MPAEIFLGSWCDESESPVANLRSDNRSTVKKCPDADRESPPFPSESVNGDFVITLTSTVPILGFSVSITLTRL